MKFGPTPLTEAEGRILAHTLRLPDGTTLRKGRVLTPGDLATLEAGGVEEPVTAFLEPGDLGENEAAARLAGVVAGDGVRAESPRVGRVNLVAIDHGVLTVDPAAVAALNRLDEAVQISTLPPWTPVEPDTLVASVKIVTFGVSGAVVDRAETVARTEAERSGGGGPDVRWGPVAVAAYRRLRVGLVLTRFPETRERSLELARDRVAERVRARTGLLMPARSCPHKWSELRRTLTELREAGAELLLVFGASATVDRGDVLPRALEEGGQVHQLGMPVDPGNLLLLGELAGTPVVGVPGCARSPRPSGFDRVLDRLLAGLPIGPAELAGMGVGGLLTDVADRPEPRSGPPVRPARIAGLVLAAGSSRRMGDENKLLLPVEGEPMVRRVARAALEAGLEPVVAVIGHQGQEVEAALADLPVTTVSNPHHPDGLSTSLSAGLARLTGDGRTDGGGRNAIGPDAAAILLGDMPWVDPATIRALADAFRPEAGASICVPVHEGKRGNPVLWGRRHWARMRALAGDRGARTVLVERAEEVVEVPVDDPGVLQDVDEPGMLRD